jgi:hypothetical protein
MALPVQTATMEQLVRKALRAQQVLREQPEQMVLPEQMATMEQQDLKVRKV